MSLKKLLTTIRKNIKDLLQKPESTSCTAKQTPNKTDGQEAIKTENLKSAEYLLNTSADVNVEKKIGNDDRPLLKLKRYCGDEFFPITKAAWHISVDDELGNELWLEIETDYGIILHKEFEAGYDPESYIQPKWELYYCEKINLQESHLKVGFRGEIPLGLEDREFTNFYYYEHGPTDKNIIEVLERKGDRLHISVTGEVEDVAFYDGSKPKTKLSVEAWFDPMY